jgi:branched-chain amino acid transport system permease protein
VRNRDLVASVGAFAATVLAIVGLFIVATGSPNQLSFANPNQRWMWYYLIVGLMLLSAFFINRMRRSRIGRAWMAMREDELAAAAMGIDIVRTKLLAFSMGATFSGFAGAYFAAYIQAIFPSTFDFSVSVIVLCMVILGGLGNMVGVVIGGLIIMSADRLFLPQISSFIQDLSGTTQQPFFNNLDVSLYRLALFGLVLVIMMQVRPEGLVPNQRRKMELTGDAETVGRENSALYDAERDPQLAAE